MTTIEDFAFDCCDKITTMTIPSSVKVIGHCAFRGCAFRTLTLEDGGPLSVGGSGYNVGSALTPINDCHITLYCGRNITCTQDWGGGPFMRTNDIESITYGPQVTELNVREFGGCTSLKSVRFLNPDLVTIPEDAFSNCNALTSVQLPSRLKILGKSSFSGCEKLTELKLPATLVTIHDYALCGCGFTELTIPAAVTDIEYGAWSSCRNLRKVTFEDTTMPCNFHRSCFDYIYEEGRNPGVDLYLGRPLQMPDDEYRFAFGFGYGIRSVTYGPSVTSIPKGEFCRSNLQRVDMSRSGITVIPESAFSETYLVSVKYPAGLKEIGESAFYYTQLKSVSVPEGVTQLGSWCFSMNDDCPITSIVLPASMTSLGYCTLDMQNVRSITCRAAVPPACDGDPFGRIDKSTCKLYVPAGSLNAYKEAEYWKDFYIISNQTPTAIDAIDSEQTAEGNAPCYTLDGRRVSGQPTERGIYLRNGRKVLVK